MSLETDFRPWGHYEVLLDEPTYKIKRIFIEPGHRLSYQKHLKREELWTVVQGEMTVVIESEESIHHPGDVIHVPCEALHRMGNKGSETVILIEIQRGSYFGEDDIIRVQDDYAREDEPVA